MQQQSLGLKSQSTAFIPRTRGSIIVVCTPRSTHPCVIAAARLSRPYCTRPPSNDLGGLFALCIRDALLISAYYILILCRSSHTSRTFRLPIRGRTRGNNHAYVITRPGAGADMPGGAGGGDATEESPHGTGRKLFSLSHVGFTEFPGVVRTAQRHFHLSH